MTPNELVEALIRAEPIPESVIDSLSRNVVAQALAPIRAVVPLLNDPDPRISAKAAHLLSGTGGLATAPLLESPEPRAPSDKLWVMGKVLRSHLAERGEIVARLDSMLDDRTLMDWGTVAGTEEKPKPSRVCDQAYLLMRRILKVNESAIESIHERKAFLALSDREKDVEIQKAKGSHAWSNLVGKED